MAHGYGPRASAPHQQARTGAERERQARVTELETLWGFDYAGSDGRRRSRRQKLARVYGKGATITR